MVLTKRSAFQDDQQARHTYTAPAHKFPTSGPLAAQQGPGMDQRLVCACAYWRTCHISTTGSTSHHSQAVCRGVRNQLLIVIRQRLGDNVLRIEQCAHLQRSSSCSVSFQAT